MSASHPTTPPGSPPPAEGAVDPSMEDILASIRRILSDDETESGEVHAKPAEAPTEDVLVTARMQLGLAAGVPVPLDVGIAFTSSTGAPLPAIKTVYLDDSADNPTLGTVTPATSLRASSDKTDTMFASSAKAASLISAKGSGSTAATAAAAAW